jgi:MarR family 2-MHQ and catechol resistance regulon transcriptional repressor
MKKRPPGKAAPRDTALTLWVVLARAFDSISHHARDSIARFKLGATEFGVLEVLYHKGELPVCEVQRRILVESSSTTYVVDKLVARRLVRRRASDADRRVVLLSLTPAGHRIIRRFFPQHAEAIRYALGALSPQEQALAARLLRTLGTGAVERRRTPSG